MNERFKELVVKAGIYDCEPDDPDLEVDEDYIKLIKLVVQECAKIVTMWSSEVPSSEGYDIQPVHMMKQHFGVE